jgi:radical SAM superfamily enzyme YgiQ (UPF0313 family)
MKVALVYPQTIMGVPYGLLYIAAVLERNGYKPAIFNEDNGEESFIKDVVDYAPDVVGISLVTPQYPRALEIAKALKARIPSCIIVAGGVHATALPGTVLDEMSCDYVVMGEGEYVFPELCEKIKNRQDASGIKGIACKIGDRLIINERRDFISDLDSLPFPARHLIDFERYILPPGHIRGYWFDRSTFLLTSRGCPFYCAFCACEMLYRRTVRVHSIDRIIADIKFLIDQYEVEAIQFLDDIFAINPSRMLEFCRKIRDENINLKFSCQLRVDTVREDVLREMKKAGFIQVELGIESGSDKVLKILKKNTTREKIERGIELVKKVGLRAMGTFIIGSPGETMEDIKETENLARKLDLNFMDFFIMTPFPGTQMHEMAIKNNWIKVFNYKNWTCTNPVMETSLAMSRIAKMRSRLENTFSKNKYEFYLKNPIYFLKVLRLFLRNPGPLFMALRQFFIKFSIADMTASFMKNYMIKMIARKK